MGDFFVFLKAPFLFSSLFLRCCAVLSLTYQKKKRIPLPEVCTYLHACGVRIVFLDAAFASRLFAPNCLDWLFRSVLPRDHARRLYHITRPMITGMCGGGGWQTFSNETVFQRERRRGISFLHFTVHTTLGWALPCLPET